MKHVRLLGLLASAAVLSAVAACSTNTASSDGESSSSDAIEASDIPAAALAEVKKETGRDGVGARPIFEPDSFEPAYYEVQLNPGWAVVTARGDAHVVEWAPGGRSPTERLDLGARAAMKRVYRLDAAVYIAADETGKAVGRSTKGLVKIDRSGDEPKLVEVSNDEALATWRLERANLVNAQLKNSGQNLLRTQDGPLIGGAPPEKTCSVKGDVPSYSQLSPGEGPNTTSCASGCGPTAWATIFGWANRRATENAAEDGAFAGFFASEAPLTMTPEIGQLSMDLNHVVHTTCSGDQGATTPWDMAQVKTWVAAHASGVTVDQRYNFLMMSDPAIRDLTVDALCDGRPVIIGIGTMFGGDGHYPIAKGYSNGKFELEMGWGGDGNGWYDATTWYMGTIRH
jgi:hypothetical protein